MKYVTCHAFQVLCLFLDVAMYALHVDSFRALFAAHVVVYPACSPFDCKQKNSSSKSGKTIYYCTVCIHTIHHVRYTTAKHSAVQLAKVPSCPHYLQHDSKLGTVFIGIDMWFIFITKIEPSDTLILRSWKKL